VGFEGSVRIAKYVLSLHLNEREITENHPHQKHTLLLSNIPYQGGGDYRGYIGLLLNAPYKRIV
jgi:hypothetical protein